jgi:hypothetical protein
VTRGSNDQQLVAAPSTATFTLLNGDGRFTRGNPLSPYYPNILHNAPVRVSDVVAADSVARTVSNGWGSTDTGQTWLPAAAGLSVAGGFAIHNGLGANSIRTATATQALTDAEVRYTFTPDAATVTGADLETAALLRYVDSNNYYMVRVVISSVDQQYRMQAWRFKGGSFTQIRSSVDTGLFFNTAGPVRIAGGMEGRTLYGKMWEDGTDEPVDWLFTQDDSNDVDAFHTAAAWGIRSGRVTGNTNTSYDFQYSNISVEQPRFHGYLTSFKPTWDESHKHKTVAASASDYLQQLRTGKSPIKSPIRRATEQSAGLLAYWPMEDAEGSTYVASGIEGAGPMVHGGTGFIPNFEEEKGFVASAPILQLQFADLYGPIPVGTAATGDLTTRFLLHVQSTGTVDARVIHRVFFTGGTINFVDIQYKTGGGLVVEFYGFANNLIHASGTIGFGVDGDLLRVQLVLEQTGANVHYEISTLEVGQTVGGTFGNTVNTVTMGDASRAVFNPYRSMPDVGLGHASVHNAVLSLFAGDDELMGYLGERAATRFARNLIENGIPVQLWGDPANTVQMGVQLTGTLDDILQTTSDADESVIFSMKALPGLAFRSRWSMYNQSSRLTLAYDAREVAAPLEPGEDNIGLLNDLKLTREGGSSVRVRQMTGDRGTDVVGTYDEQETINVATDDVLSGAGQSRVLKGTVTDIRWPEISIIRATLSAAKADASRDVSIGDRLEATGLQAADVYEDIDQLVTGYTEVFYTKAPIRVVYRGVSYAPYQIYTIEDVFYLDGDVTLAEDLDLTETGVNVTPVSGQITTNPAHWPQTALIDGEHMTVTAVSALAGGQQTLTVVRAVNGARRTHLTGAAVTFRPKRYLVY